MGPSNSDRERGERPTPRFPNFSFNKLLGGRHPGSGVKSTATVAAAVPPTPPSDAPTPSDPAPTPVLDEKLSLPDILQLLAHSEHEPSTLLAYTRVATVQLPIVSPVPRADVVTQALLRVCSASCPADLRCAGFELLLTYITVTGNVINSIDRSAFWMIIKGAGPGLVGSAEEWKSRSSVLSSLTESGKEVDGFQGLVPWLSGLARRAASCRLPNSISSSTSEEYRPVDAEADGCLNWCLTLLTEVLRNNAQTMTPFDISMLVDTFDGIVMDTLVGCDVQGGNWDSNRFGGPVVASPTATTPLGVPGQSSSTTSLPLSRSHANLGSGRDQPPAEISRPPLHRRNPSSSSSYLLKSEASAFTSSPNSPQSTKHILPGLLYASFITQLQSTSVIPHTSLHKIIATLMLLLSRGIEVLPRLDVKKPTPAFRGPAALGALPPYTQLSNIQDVKLLNVRVEAAIWEVMRSLLSSSAYSVSTARSLKKLLLNHPVSPSPTTVVPLMPPPEDNGFSGYLGGRYAEGAARTMRLALRRAAEGRLARHWLSNQSTSYTHTGAPTFLSHSSFQHIPGIPGDGQAEDDSGSSTPDVNEMLQRAWGKEGEGGAWEVERVSTVLPEAIRIWVGLLDGRYGAGDDGKKAREGDWEKERVVRECLGVVNDLIEESVRTDDKHSLANLGVVEGRLIGEVMFEAVKCVEKYRLQEPYVIELEHPYAEHPTPLLRTLCYVLSRLPPCQPQFLGLNTGGMSSQRFLPPSIAPSLPASLLSVAPHVQDESLARLLRCYLLEGSLTPSAPNWLQTLQTLFDAVGLGSTPPTATSGAQSTVRRTQARKALGEVVTAVYQEVRDHRPHRVALLSMCLAVWERSYAEDEGIEIIDGVWTVIADGIVAGAADEDPRNRQSDKNSVSGLDLNTGGVENGQLELRLRRLVCRVARDAVCPLDRPGRGRPDRPESVRPALATIPPSGPQSTANSPIRSSSVASPTPTRANTTNEPSMAPFRSLLTALASPVHAQSMKSQQDSRTSAGETPEASSTDDLPNAAEPTASPHSGCRSLSAVLSLVDAFHSLAFAPPHSLSSASAYSRTARAPASHRCIDVFRDMLALLTPDTVPPLTEDELQWHERATKETSPTGVGQASCPRARLAILQWMVRLRAHRDHRLYIMKDLDAQLEPLASIIGRCPSNQTSDEQAQSPPVDEKEGVRRNRSLTRRGPPVPPDAQRRGRDQVVTAEFGRARALSRDQRPAASRSPSQPPGAAPREEPIWRVPEVLPFEVHVGTRPSEGMTTYEAGMASADTATTSLWLPTSAYICCLLDVVRDEANPEILSYALCHLPLQLANKHFFCGPMTSKVMVPFTGIVLNVIQSNHLASRFSKARYPEILSLSYHVLTVLVSYKRLFNRPILEAIVEAFQSGLNRYPVTVKPCLLGLTIAAFELQSQITRSLSKILGQLSLIVTNPAVSVHILEFLIILGNIPALYANFTEEDYKRVFTVALRYIQHHNHAVSANSQARSHALSQHLRAIAYYTIYVWFIAVKLPERPKYVPHITRNLLIANERKGVVEVDEPTEVCFDWLARAAYGNADPKPTRSFLGDVLTGGDEDATLSQKTWLQGNAVITIKSLKRPGWVELECRRPSGMTRFHCRLENIRLGSLLDDVEDFSEAGLQTPKVSTTSSFVDLHSTVGDMSSSSGESIARENGIEVTGESEAAQSGVLVAPSMSTASTAERAREVLIDPSFLALQVSPYPDSRKVPRSTLVPPTEEFKRTLRNLDRVPVIDSHTIGVMYVAPSQITEEDILSNRHGSPAYTRFLHGLGRLIHLKNQKDVYTGGLDTYSDEDGKYTYAWWNDIIQVLYHVTTLMPNRSYDPQYAHKKKHVGNDYVRIVWNDSGVPYRFDTLKTEFQFANVVIEPHSAGVIGAYTNAIHDHEYFKVSCQRAAGMPEFGPLGEFKIISAESLPAYVREVSLLADFFAPVWVHTHRDTRTAEYVTNWRSRLQTIKRLRAALAATSQPTEDLSEDAAADLAVQEKARDFTRVY